MTVESQRWDLVVLGAGSAGLTAARTARLLGAQVLLVERHRWGGDCLWTGCVPSKTLISRARDRHTALAAGAPPAGTDSMLAAVGRARERVAPGDSPEALHDIGVATAHGDAVFSGNQSLTIDGQPIRFSRAIVATGSRPAMPDIHGLADVNPLTSDTIWDLQSLPGRMLVVGGGPIGCELTQALARLGVDVALVHRGPEILPAEIPQARSVIRRALEADGVRILTHRYPARFDTDSHGYGHGTAVMDDGTRVGFDRVLVATGRRPATDRLGLDIAGIGTDPGGWVTSGKALRTANRVVWAAGDVTWLPKHTHLAGVSGAVATRNALLGTRKTMTADGAPRVIFTSPEVASVGQQAAGEDDRCVTVSHRHLDRAIAEDDTAGFTKITVDRRGRILGGTIVSPRAGESIGELALAVDRKVTVDQLTSVIHPYPTFNDGVWNAAIVESQRRIRDGLTGRAADLLRRWNLRTAGREGNRS